MPDPTSDTTNRVLSRISATGPSGVWSKADFLDIGTPHAIEKALQRLTTQGSIRRVHRGLYDQPKRSGLTGALVFPPRSAFVDAIARRDKLRVLVDGMTAANDLGLTTAVPAQSIIHADTYPRTIEIEASVGDPAAKKPVIYRLDFKRAAASSAFWAGHPAMRIIQAIDWFKDAHRNDTTLIAGLKDYLRRTPKRLEIIEDLRANLSAAPSWMYPLINALISDTQKDADDAQPLH